MAIKTIKCWVYDTEAEMQSVIDAINVSCGLPKGNVLTYCEGQENNGKWVIKRTPDMDTQFAEAPVDFNYIEPDL